MSAETTEGAVKAPARRKTQPKVRLVTSALFFTASCPVPPGIRARDIGFMVEGLADEHSPLPLEQTAWGFLLDNRSSRNSHIFYYAAARELVFKSASEATDLGWTAILPAFVATSGLRFEHATWLFLKEEECLTAIRFESGSSAPSRVYSRFLKSPDAGPAELFAQRRSIIDKLPVADNENILPGLFRVSKPMVTARGRMAFQLQTLTTEDGEWEDWKRTEFKKPTRLQAADIRDHHVLSAHTERRGTGKRLVYVLGALAACAAILVGFELQQARRQSEAVHLASLAEEQAPEVQRLQDIEAMTKSLKQVFEEDFTPYLWLMALNTQRPQAIHFTSYAFDNQGTISVNGQVPEVKALNTYVEALKKNPKFEDVELGKLTTDKDGANFTLKAKAGDLSAPLPPGLIPEPEAPTGEGEQVAEESGSETETDAESSEESGAEPETEEAAS